MLKFLLKAGLLAAGTGLVLGALKKMEDERKEKDKDDFRPEEDSLQAKPDNMPETPLKVEPLNENLVEEEMKTIQEEAEDGAKVVEDVDQFQEKLNEEGEDLPATVPEELPAVEAPEKSEEK